MRPVCLAGHNVFQTITVDIVQCDGMRLRKQNSIRIVSCLVTDDHMLDEVDRGVV